MCLYFCMEVFNINIFFKLLIKNTEPSTNQNVNLFYLFSIFIYLKGNRIILSAETTNLFPSTVQTKETKLLLNVLTNIKTIKTK